MAIGNHGKIGSTVMFHVVGALRLGKGIVLNLFMEVKPAQDQVRKRETATLILVQVHSNLLLYDASSSSKNLKYHSFVFHLYFIFILA